eukprot:scaffold202206_cov26-Tisochrysis_lutea.AAC.2
MDASRSVGATIRPISKKAAASVSKTASSSILDISDGRVTLTPSAVCTPSTGRSLKLEYVSMLASYTVSKPRTDPAGKVLCPAIPTFIHPIWPFRVLPGSTRVDAYVIAAAACVRPRPAVAFRWRAKGATSAGVAISQTIPGVDIRQRS